MTHVRSVTLPVRAADAASFSPFGRLLMDDLTTSLMNIPYYQGEVIEGGNVEFHCEGNVVPRTSKILRGRRRVTWLERHERLTQLFIALGGGSFRMVVCPPDPTTAFPAVERVIAFEFAPGAAVLLHRGTWHDFPLPVDTDVTVLVFNSVEVIRALTDQASATEISDGDVRKIDLRARFSCEFEVV